MCDAAPGQKICSTCLAWGANCGWPRRHELASAAVAEAGVNSWLSATPAKPVEMSANHSRRVWASKSCFISRLLHKQEFIGVEECPADSSQTMRLRQSGGCLALFARGISLKTVP